jgi:hypothetical protein
MIPHFSTSTFNHRFFLFYLSSLAIFRLLLCCGEAGMEKVIRNFKLPSDQPPVMARDRALHEEQRQPNNFLIHLRRRMMATNTVANAGGGEKSSVNEKTKASRAHIPFRVMIENFSINSGHYRVQFIHVSRPTGRQRRDDAAIKKLIERTRRLRLLSGA